MNERIDIELEVGERSPAELRSLERLEHTLTVIEHLLREILRRTPIPHYPATTDGVVTVE